MLPQVPQLLLSVSGSEQVPPGWVAVAGHALFGVVHAAQAPLMQADPVAQMCDAPVLPQAPQLFGSLAESTQVVVVPVVQLICVPGHLQTPEVQTVPLGHALPHFAAPAASTPQLALSPIGSMQVPGAVAVLPHTLRPVEQPQTPAEQVAPAAQTVPHAPQLLGSTCVSEQVVPHTVSGLTQGPVSVAVSPTAVSPVAVSPTAVSPVAVSVTVESSPVAVSGAVSLVLPSSPGVPVSSAGMSFVELPHPAAARPKAPSASGSHHRVLRMQPPKLPSTLQDEGQCLPLPPAG
jgi:hypothetical protein